MTLATLTAFAVGASFPGSFITISYLTHQANKDINLNKLEILVRIAYGLANIVNVHFGNTLESSLIVGAMFGFLLSVVGRFRFQIPRKVFGMKKETEWRVHVVAPILYALIFVLLIRNLNKIIAVPTF